MDETRRRVLTEVSRLFAMNGFHGTTLTQLAEAVGGVSVSLLTEAFGDKEALFYAAIEFSKDSADEEVESALRVLLPKVRKATLNSKLKTFHRGAIARLSELDDT